ncbi:hypothetical protein EJ08DRAFT_665373 [Tothia fuscella]|uniref:Uncharacterized protein n=1 Tax=Tothia fuscella TaxID=1048955 RepID=A0A9P4TTE1_9PEZI|nr:hypothetical protein EJ08DRAFT_665373 [Tothia fuscella]
MDALSYAPRALTLESRAPRFTCYTDKRTHRQVCRKESFFHRVGRYILIAVLLFLAITAVCVLLCCLKLRKKKSKDLSAAEPNANSNLNGQYGEPQKRGIGGLIAKLTGKNKSPTQQGQQYNLDTAQPNGVYGGKV